MLYAVHRIGTETEDGRDFSGKTVSYQHVSRDDRRQIGDALVRPSLGRHGGTETLGHDSCVNRSHPTQFRLEPIELTDASTG